MSPGRFRALTPPPPVLGPMSTLDAAEVALRKAFIVAVGLPCLVEGVRVEGTWACLDLRPLEGWTHLVSEEELKVHEARGERYHVSLGYDVDVELLEKLHQRWAGVRTTVAIDHVRDSSVAILAWGDGLGGDWDVWAALAQGYPRRVRFGLHVSM